MFRKCRHRMPTGIHCQSPAMGNSVYCYHHDRLHRRLGMTGRRPKPLQLPTLDSRDALLAGLTGVMNAALARKIDSRQAGRLIYGMQVAASNLPNASSPAKPPSA